MKKIILITLFSLILIGCENEKKEYINRLNNLIETDFDYSDERIIVEQDQDFSSHFTSITIPLTTLEKEKILNINKDVFTEYNTNIDSITYKGFSYEIENNKSRESIYINIKKDSAILNYSIFIE